VRLIVALLATRGDERSPMALGTYRETLSRPGIQPFLWAQFLGAFNDNLLKITLSLLVIHAGVDAAGGRALSLVGAVFVLPFLLLSGFAGQLADIHSKRTVLILTKAGELAVAAVAVVALMTGQLGLLYLALFLFASLSTFFSPAKYGILPELLPAADLAPANGLLEMSTFVAIVAGTATGSYLFGISRNQLWLVGVVIAAIATIGAATSLAIPRVPAAAPQLPLRMHPWAGLADGVRQLRSNRGLLRAVVGISYFWFLAALLQLVMVLFGTQVLNIDDRWIGTLTACAAIGIGAGSLVAGALSTMTRERRLTSTGLLGITVATTLLSYTRTTATAALALGVVGFCSGLFVVPLNARLQRCGTRSELGRLMATNNIFNMGAVLLASAVLWVSSDLLTLTPDRLILAVGLTTLVASVGVQFKRSRLRGRSTSQPQHSSGSSSPRFSRSES
jgi:acyl-[acyl-carrier-protein]-phospholipid O-acyltransferase / long-chain-fatty-acid--[acyl-carrier-protein] ligase